MSAAALLLALLAVAFALVAFWRVRGRPDEAARLEQLRRELEALRARQAELLEGATRTLAAALEAGRRRLGAIAHDIARLSDEAPGELDDAIQRLQQHLTRLSRALEEAAAAARDATLAAAQEQGRALLRRVHHLAARVALVEVKARAARAVRAVEGRDFAAADQRLAAAADRLLGARESLLGEHEDAVAELRADLAALRASVQAQAGDVRARSERLMADVDRLIAALGGDEPGGRGQAAAV